MYKLIALLGQFLNNLADYNVSIAKLNAISEAVTGILLGLEVGDKVEPKVKCPIQFTEAEAAHIRKREKIPAIKSVKDRTGWGLVESKRYVEQVFPEVPMITCEEHDRLMREQKAREPFKIPQLTEEQVKNLVNADSWGIHDIACVLIEKYPVYRNDFDGLKNYLSWFSYQLRVAVKDSKR